ncbi:DUF3267 domain-containing protein [Halomicroarcula sp. GCM10025324]|uniref:DUF3267 domain-containing protein n=1 Tax=Haloarcula TaxID=2237 RepID=UPI0023E7ABEE|nr:DUF3267 domain-containing protein [Halomicroarcula sp. ZS-22-S1]
MNNVPPERVLADLELTRGLTIQMLAIGTLGMLVGWTLFSGLYQVTTGNIVTFQFAPASVGWLATPLNILVLVFLGTVILVPHELLHGLAIRYYGGEPRYGVGVAHFVLPYAYATTDHEFTRNQFIVVLLTPLVVMTLVGVPLMLLLEWGWLAIPLTLNAAGAVADVWMTLMVVSYPAHIRIVDHENGVRILGRDSDRPRSLSITSLVWDALAGAAVALFGVGILLALAGPILLSALGVESITVGKPGTLTYLFAFVNTPNEISISLGPGVLSVGGLLGLLYAFMRSYRRGKRAPTEAT